MPHSHYVPPYSHGNPLMNTSTPTLTPPDPDAGYRLLREDEPWQLGDEARTSTSMTGKWYNHSMDPGDTIRQCVKRDNRVDQLYVRRKIEDPIAELTAKLTEARDNAAKAACYLANLEATHKEATEIRVGDWVVCVDGNAGVGPITPGRCYKVLEGGGTDTEPVYIINNNGKRDWFFAKRFTKATSIQIAAHLAANPPVPLLPKLHGYDGQYSKLADAVLYGCAVIPLDLLRSIVFYKPEKVVGNRTLASITLDSGKTLTIADIRAILAHVDYNAH